MGTAPSKTTSKIILAGKEFWKMEETIDSDSLSYTTTTAESVSCNCAESLHLLKEDFKLNCDKHVNVGLGHYSKST